MNCRCHNRRRWMRVQWGNRTFVFCFLFCLEIEYILCMVSMFFIAAHNMTEWNEKQKTDDVNTQIADRWMMFHKFIEESGFFWQFTDIDKWKIMLWVFLALPSEVKIWMTQKILAAYLWVQEDTLTNRKYTPEVWRVQKWACVQFLQSSSTKEVIEYIAKMAKWQTDRNPAPAQKLYLQFIEWRSEKIALDTNSPITVVFGWWKSSFVNSEDDEADDQKKTKSSPVKTADTEKTSAKRSLSRTMQQWKKK